jgi:Flp pilus assembly protein TadG
MNIDIPINKLIRCRRGSSAVEFAMVLPIFLVFLFGTVAYGSYLSVIHGVQQLAAEAARSSVAGLSETERGSIASSFVTANAGTYPMIDSAKLAVSAATSPTNANVFVVTVNYDASNLFIYSLPLVPLPPKNIARSAMIPYGGF